ncbi:MAG: hypothetical protein ABMA13_01640 [Chthoniobacteraceae bacterium]
MRSVLFIFLAFSTVAVAKDPTPSPLSRSSQVTGNPDLNKQFNPGQFSGFGRSNSGFRTKDARADGFSFQQKFTPKGYDAKGFETKGWWAGKFKFDTKAADTKGKYDVPNAAKTADTKTAPVKDARESGKTAATRDLPDGDRPYLGREAQKMKTALDPGKLPRVTSDLRELKTIEDVKALLNKN